MRRGGRRLHCCRTAGRGGENDRDPHEPEFRLPEPPDGSRRRFVDKAKSLGREIALGAAASRLTLALAVKFPILRLANAGRLACCGAHVRQRQDQRGGAGHPSSGTHPTIPTCG